MRSRWALTVGFLAAGLCGCAAVEAPCAGVDCGVGRCVAEQGRPVCHCPPGSVAQGHLCVWQDQASACANYFCMGSGRECTAVDGVPRCLCGSGYHGPGDYCVQSDPCLPNPCTLEHKTVCTATEGAAARCTCEPGYAPDGERCAGEPEYDCARQHQVVGDDPFEPDECPELARTVELGAPRHHSISPADDEDWMRLEPAGTRVVELVVTGSPEVDSLIALDLDVYAADGVTALAADHRSLTQPTLRFPFGPEAARYVRVRGLAPTDLGEYTLTAHDLGPDDYPDSADEAQTAAQPARFRGEVQYPGDEDYQKVSVEGGRSYSFYLDLGSSAAVELIGLDGVTVLKVLDAATVTSRNHTTHPAWTGAYTLRARSAATGGLGSFFVSVIDLGVDDHGDFEVDATPVLPAGVQTSASFERSGDADLLRFPVVAGRIYAMTCSVPAPDRCAIALRDQAGVVVGATTFVEQGDWVSAEAMGAGSWFAVLTPVGGAGIGGYTWKLEDLGPDDFGDTFAAAAPLVPGVPLSGALQLRDDKDVFSFPAAGQHVYRAALEPGGALGSWAVLSVYDDSGKWMSSSSSGALAFLTPTSGRWYLEVKRSASNGLGSYSLRVSDQGVDDHGDTPATATGIGIGGSVPGDTQYPGDTDVFAFPTIVGHIYFVACAPQAAGLCGVAVRDATSARVASAANGPASFKAGPGQYTVEVAADVSGALGAYTLSITDAGLDDHGDTAATGTLLTAGTGAVSGAIQFTRDVDTFKFTAVANRAYSFVCATTPGSTLRLIDRDPWGGTFGGFVSSHLAFLAGSDGVFSIEVSSPTGSAFPRPYSCELSDLGVDEGDTAAAASPVTPGVTVSGNIQYAGDVDWFSLTLAASTTYAVSFNGLCVDSYVIRPDGVSEVTTVTSPEGRTFTTQAGGGYYVAVIACYPDLTGPYTFTVQ